MNKNEIELIILKVIANGEEALNMKIYKEGTVCRHGVGGLPQLGISAMSHFGDSRFFDPLLEKIPDDLTGNPQEYKEETPNGSLEYILAFYGVSTNGQHGEQAAWSKSTGIRLLLDQQTSFRHPVLSFIDAFSMDAVEITNEWYFDVIMNIMYDAKSSTLPPQTLIATPKTRIEIEEDCGNYVSQMLGSTRNWDMRQFVMNKTYEVQGITTQGKVTLNNGSVDFNFQPEDDQASKPKKKPWWKF